MWSEWVLSDPATRLRHQRRGPESHEAEFLHFRYELPNLDSTVKLS